MTTETAQMNEVPMSSALGQRISIVGAGGKTTLARAIAEKTRVTHIEMDAIFWKPNWVESDPEEFAANMESAIAGAPDGWVTDGHYWSRLNDTVLGKADMVIWLDLPWLVMFWRMLRRSFKRAWDKEKICGDNTESWRKMFTREALWWYWVRHPRRMGGRGGRLQQLVPQSTPVIRLRSAKELDRFYQVHGFERR